jgi:hypothetical protein
VERNVPQELSLLPHADAVHYGWILVVYRVYAGEHAEAEQHLREALVANRGKHRNTFTESKLRCYEVFFLLMRGELVQADEAIARHSRFVRRQVERPGHSQVLRFLTGVRELTRCIGVNHQRAAELTDEFVAEFTGVVQFVFLFRTLYSKYFENQVSRVA